MAEQSEEVVTAGGIAFPIVPFRADEGLVFARFEAEEGEPQWMLTTPEVAGADVIKCSRCDRPAVQLDHCWPYQNETTLCAAHVEVHEEEQRQANRELRQRLRRLPEVEAQAALVPALELELEALRTENARMRPVYDAALRVRRAQLANYRAAWGTEERAKRAGEWQNAHEVYMDAVDAAVKAEDDRLPRCAVCGEPIPADHARIIELGTERQAHASCEAGFMPGKIGDDQLIELSDGERKYLAARAEMENRVMRAGLVPNEDAPDA